MSFPWVISCKILFTVTNKVKRRGNDHLQMDVCCERLSTSLSFSTPKRDPPAPQITLQESQAVSRTPWVLQVKDVGHSSEDGELTGALLHGNYISVPIPSALWLRIAICVAPIICEKVLLSVMTPWDPMPVGGEGGERREELMFGVEGSARCLWTRFVAWWNSSWKPVWWARSCPSWWKVLFIGTLQKCVLQTSLGFLIFLHLSFSTVKKYLLCA